MMNSFNNGRILEFCIVRDIVLNYSIDMDTYTEKKQKEDNIRFHRLTDDKKKRFSDYSKKFVDNLKKQVTKKNKLISVHRSTDSEGQRGIVTDIKIKVSDNSFLQYSIKHNNKSIKHNRPSNLISQLLQLSGNELRNNPVNQIYREKYNNITCNFLRICQKENKSLYKEFTINEKKNLLYKPVCNLVSDYINCYRFDQNVCNNFLRFLIGENYTKVTFLEGELKYQVFDKIPSISKMSSSVRDDSYVDVTFYSESKKVLIVVGMRLHSAKTSIGTNVSIKFDSVINGICDEFFGE